MKWYPEVVESYFEKQSSFEMLYYDGMHSFRIKSLDFGYDAASIICIDDSAYRDEEQAISLNRLEDILLAKETPPLRFIYVNRWHDEKGVPHYHGVYSKYPTLALAQKHTVFTALAIAVDLVYQAESEEDMFAYLADVNRNSGNDSENLDSLGTMDWL
jgi:hypothetical protein